MYALNCVVVFCVRLVKLTGRGYVIRLGREHRVRIGAGVFRRALVVLVALVVCLGLASAGAEAAVSVVAPALGTPGHGAGLSAQRALVRQELATREHTASSGQAAADAARVRGMSVSQRRALVAQARAAAERPVTPAASVASPAAPYEASPRSAVSAAAPSMSAVASSSSLSASPAASGDSGSPTFTWLTGPGGVVVNCDQVCESLATVVPGEPLTVSTDVFNSSDPPVSEQVQVTWTQQCGQSSAAIATQTVTAPSIFGTSPAVVASAPFTALTACAGQDVASDISDVTPEYQVAATATVVGGSAGSTDDDLFWIDVPLSELIACPGSLDSAGAGNPQGNCGDPVDTASGAFADSFTDATVRSAGYPLVIARSYSSADSASGSLGPGWSLPWEARLSVAASTGDVTFTAENGDAYVYEPALGGGFYRPPGALSKLSETTGSSGSVTGYKLTAPDNHVLKFSASGQLTAEVDPTGRGLAFAYGSSGQVSSITTASGGTVTLTYSGSLLSQAALPDGNDVTYGYTGGLLTSVTDPDGDTANYGYDASGLLASVQDPDGNYTARNTYNASGQVTSQEDGAGNVTGFSYTTTSGGLAEADVTGPDGGITSHVYDDGLLDQVTGPLGDTTGYVYSDRLQPQVVTDPLGHVTTTYYDDNGDVHGVMDPLGNEPEWSYSGFDMTSSENAAFNAASFAYNSLNEVTSATSPAGEKTTFTYDSAGNLVSSVDPRGNASGATASKYTTAYAYNTTGLLASVTNPDGGVTRYTYDPMGYPLTVTDPEGNVTTYAYDSDERVTSVTAPSGAVTRVRVRRGGEPGHAHRPGRQHLDGRLRRR